MRHRLVVAAAFVVAFGASVPCHAEVRFQRTIDGKSVTFMLDEWVKLADGSFKNFRTHERKTAGGFWDYANGLAMDTAFAAGQAYGHYKAVEAEFVERHAKIMQMREAAFRNMLDKPVAENPSVTYRELLAFPPAVARADFVPRQVRMGPMAWLSEDSQTLDIPVAIDDLPRDLVRQVIAHQILHRLNLHPLTF